MPVLERMQLIVTPTVTVVMQLAIQIHLRQKLLLTVRGIVFAETASVAWESRVTVLLGKWIVAEMGPALLAAVLTRLRLTVIRIVTVVMQLAILV